MAVIVEKPKPDAGSEASRRTLTTALDRLGVEEPAHPSQEQSPLHKVRKLSPTDVVKLAAQTAEAFAASEEHLKAKPPAFSETRKIAAAMAMGGWIVLEHVARTSGRSAISLLRSTLSLMHRGESALHWGALRVGQGAVWSVRTSLFAMGSFLVRTGRAIKYNLHPSSIAARHRDMVTFIHRLLFDRHIEKYMFVPAQTPAELEKLTIRSTHKKWGADYRPTPSRVFRWATKPLPRDLSQYTFVDFGAGRGRVLLLAAKQNFKKVMGTEFARELHEDALMNIAQFPRSLMKCRDIDCLQVTATQMPIPDGPAVFYFFHPFDQEVFSRVLKQITASYRRAPRRLYLITVDYDMDSLIRQEGIFEPLSYSLADKMKHTLFSPLKIRSYHTLV